MARTWPLRVPKRAVILQPYAIPVQILGIIWVAIVSWFESGTFKNHVSYCSWPEADAQNAAMHVLVIADPQVLDNNSYPGRNPWLMWLSENMVDLNMRKSWSAALSLEPDAVVFLGDMMDNGRGAILDEDYEKYYKRFSDIFRSSQALRTYYLPGNHDVGLGSSLAFSEQKIERYKKHFGPLNQEITLGSHPAVLIDAPGLVEEDRERYLAGIHYAEWAKTHPRGTIAFLQAIRDRNSHTQPILFTHIPLSRPDDASCGPLRENGRIRQGSGHGYQNTLSPELSTFLLRSVHPSLILSGDDHDYCEYTHPMPNDVPSRQLADSAREVTVRSFSMAMGVKYPGFVLLTLAPGAAPADAPCVLPDQLGIYLHVYAPLAALSLLLLALTHAHRVRHRTRAWTLWDRREDRSDPAWFDGGEESEEGARDDEKPPAPGADSLPPPDAASVRPVRRDRSFSGIIAVWRDRFQRVYYESNAWRARAGFWRGFVKDLSELAVLPLLVFVVLNWIAW